MSLFTKSTTLNRFCHSYEKKLLGFYLGLECLTNKSLKIHFVFIDIFEVQLCSQFCTSASLNMILITIQVSY